MEQPKKGSRAVDITRKRSVERPQRKKFLTAPTLVAGLIGLMVGGVMTGVPLFCTMKRAVKAGEKCTTVTEKCTESQQEIFNLLKNREVMLIAYRGCIEIQNRSDRMKCYYKVLEEKE